MLTIHDLLTMGSEDRGLYSQLFRRSVQLLQRKEELVCDSRRTYLLFQSEIRTANLQTLYRNLREPWVSGAGYISP